MINKMHEFHNEQFRATLILRVKEAALKAFLCRSARTYESFGIQSLSDLFELEKSQLLQIVNRLIIKGKLQAHLDITSQFIIMDTERLQSGEAKELQQLSLQYAEKLEGMIENNERLIDLLAGGSLYSTYAKEKAEKAAEKAAKIAESTQNKAEVDGDF